MTSSSACKATTSYPSILSRVCNKDTMVTSSSARSTFPFDILLSLCGFLFRLCFFLRSATGALLFKRGVDNIINGFGEDKFHGFADFIRNIVEVLLIRFRKNDRCQSAAMRRKHFLLDAANGKNLT